jgi:hypothetical protein
MGELQRLLDPNPGVAENFHDRPLEERGVLGGRGIDVLSGGLIEDTYVRLAAKPDPPFVDPAPQTLIATAIEDDRFHVALGGGVLKQGAIAIAAHLREQFIPPVVWYRAWRLHRHLLPQPGPAEHRHRLQRGRCASARLRSADTGTGLTTGPAPKREWNE